MRHGGSILTISLFTVTVVKTFPRRKSVSARVIFSCPPGEVYDIAVLKLDDPGTEQQEPRLLVRPSHQGEQMKVKLWAEQSNMLLNLQ